jgi:hypothetical protein
MTALFFVGCGSPLQIAIDSRVDAEGSQNADGAVALADANRSQFRISETTAPRP